MIFGGKEPRGYRVFLNTSTLCHLNKSCVFDIHIVGILGAKSQGLSKEEQVHVSHRLPPGLRRLGVEV